MAPFALHPIPQSRCRGHVRLVQSILRTILILILALAAFWWQYGAGRLRWLILCSLLAVIVANEFVLAPVMEHLKQAMGSIDALPAGDPRRAEFGMWHGASAVLHLSASLLSAVLVSLGWSGGKELWCKP